MLCIVHSERIICTSRNNNTKMTNMMNMTISATCRSILISHILHISLHIQRIFLYSLHIENLGRMKSYKNGSRYLCIFDCDDALDVERKLLKEFNLKYDLIAGREYFEVECELTMISLFVDIVMNHKKGKADAEKPVQQTNWMTKFAFKQM